jgi:SAM-dependent methyltransferase
LALLNNSRFRWIYADCVRFGAKAVRQADAQVTAIERRFRARYHCNRGIGAVVVDIVAAKRPEIGAAGYARDDTTVEFYLRVNALLSPDHVVLDLGAGRGRVDEYPDGFKRNLVKLKGKAARVVGADVDPVVVDNPLLDEAHVIEAGAALPFADNSFDVIVCDWVIEHIDDVPALAAEVGRVLKPGGWFCARTPNRWGYVGLAARLTPKALAGSMLGRLQPGRQERDVFDKYYRCNTLGAVAGSFPAGRWENCSYSGAATPAYHGGRRLLFGAIELFQKLAPKAMNTVLFVFIRKRC